MLIVNKKAFARGMLLLVSFIVVFILFFMPLFPGHEDGTKSNGLEYADHMFNTLSKGSANFFDLNKTDNIYATIQKVEGKVVEVTVPYKADQQELQAIAATLVVTTGLEAGSEGNALRIRGDLHALLKSMADDAHLMYQNDGAAVSARHNGQDAKLVTRAWWQLGINMIKPLQRQDLNEEASTVNAVITKAVEPGYNFYNITPVRVKDNIAEVIGFLVFYVIYTMWYGFAIFELFEGFGLSMKKGKKQEV